MIDLARVHRLILDDGIKPADILLVVAQAYGLTVEQLKDKLRK